MRVQNIGKYWKSRGTTDTYQLNQYTKQSLGRRFHGWPKIPNKQTNTSKLECNGHSTRTIADFMNETDEIKQRVHTAGMCTG